jgi:MFS family permease
MEEENVELEIEGGENSPVNVRWRALILTCTGVMMVVLDSTIVNVALPSIGRDFQVSGSSLVWIVSGYVITYGSSLPIFGRLGDYYGHARIFLLGIVLVFFASLACGLAQTDKLLVGSRVVQGVGAAAVSAASIPLVMERFTELSERARALAMLSAVFAGGSSAGLLLGGLLTAVLNWRWIFLVNIPIAIVVYVLFPVNQPYAGQKPQCRRFDIEGSVTITLSLVFAVLGALRVTESGWWSLNAVLPLLAATAFGLAFVTIESRAEEPVLPFRLLANRNLVLGVSIGAFWAAAQSGWFFLCSLYLQLVLGFNSFEAGLAFIPGCLVSVVFSLGAMSKLVGRFGIVLPVIGGTSLFAMGLALFSWAPTNATFFVDVLPAMVLLGVGCGMANGPLVLCALRGVVRADYGAASGVVNSSMALAGAFALAILAGIASARTSSLVNSGSALKDALNSGYHLGFGISVFLACLAALIGIRLIRAETV